MYCAYCGKKTKGEGGYCEHCFGHVPQKKTPCATCAPAPAPTVQAPAPVPTKLCGVCGSTVHADAEFCPHCHAQMHVSAPEQTVVEEPKKNGMAVAAIICAFLFPLLGFIFGIVGASKAKTLHKGGGLAAAAIILSLVMTVVYCGLYVYFFWPYISTLLAEFGLM